MSSSPDTTPERAASYALVLFAIAIGYHVGGLFGQLLALPPGFASPIWAPAGIALAGTMLYGARVWPAVFVGSATINILIATDFDIRALSSSAVAVASFIGMGAALQAVLGAWLIKRSIGVANPLTRPGAIIRCFALAGPVSCLCNATVGVSTLVLSDTIPTSAWLVNWWTWWLGDMLGVFVTLPIALCWLARPRHVWRDRRLSVSVPLLACFAVVIALFTVARALQQRNERQELARHADAITHAVERELLASHNIVHAVAGLYQSSMAVSRREFRTFVGYFLERFPWLQGLSWNPLVRREQRAAYVQTARRDGLEDFEFWQLAASGELSRASERDEYVVVMHTEPLAENRRVLGLDIASDPTRRDALHRARDSGQSVVTGRIALAHDPERPDGFLLILPVYRDPSPTDTLTERRAKLRGYCVGAVVISKLIADVLRDDSWPQHLELRLYDISDRAAPQVLAAGQTPADVSVPRHDDTLAKRPRTPIVWTRELAFDGRTWLMEIYPTSAYFAAKQTWFLWGIVSLCLLLTGMFGVFLLLASGATVRIREQVDERTRELARANTALTSEIRERERTEAALREAKETAEAATRSRGDFLARMSHEIRTPMNAIMGMSQLILDTPLSAEQRKYLETVDAASESLLRIINDILDFSKLDAGKLDIQPEVFDPRKLIEHVERLFAARVEMHGLSLHTRVADNVPERVHGDAGRITQVLVNLIGNAVKFTDAGGRIALELTRIEDADANEASGADASHEWRILRFSVTDSGIGIPPADRARIFESFEQGAAAGKRVSGGTGLGLAISAELVALMGGRLTVDSELGRGSTFSFTVRVCDATEPEPEPTSPGLEKPVAPAPPLPALRILLAEDNPINRYVALEMLRRANHDVTAAENGREALARYQEGDFDVILMDVQMPVMDGVSATRAIRESEAATGRGPVPIIALTAHAMASEQERCLQAGMNGFVSKPVNRAELSDALHRIVVQDQRRVRGR